MQLPVNCFYLVELCKKLGILNYDCNQQKHVIFPIEPRIFNPITRKSKMGKGGKCTTLKYLSDKNDAILELISNDQMEFTIA